MATACACVLAAPSTAAPVEFAATDGIDVASLSAEIASERADQEAEADAVLAAVTRDEPAVESPSLAALDIAFPIVHTEAMLWVFGVGMLRVEEERAVGAFGVEDAVFIEAGAIELLKIVLREKLLAARTANLLIGPR